MVLVHLSMLKRFVLFFLKKIESDLIRSATKSLFKNSLCYCTEVKVRERFQLTGQSDSHLQEFRKKINVSYLYIH